MKQTPLIFSTDVDAIEATLVRVSNELTLAVIELRSVRVDGVDRATVDGVITRLETIKALI